MQIYWNKRKRFLIHKKRVQLPQDLFGTTTWPLFHCFGTQIWPPWRHVKTLFQLCIHTHLDRAKKSEKNVFCRVTLHDLKWENMIQTKKMCYFVIFMLCSVFRVCNVFECIISFAGSYTEALNDAKMAVELQPSFLKAFVRGRLTLHIHFDNIFFPKKIGRCVNIWKLSLP